MQLTDLIKNRSPGKFIHYFRNRAGLTLEDMADMTGFSLSHIGNVACMEQHPSEDALNAILQALDLSTEEAEIIRSGFQHWPMTPIIEAEDRLFNRKVAEEIWVVGHIPSNYSDAYLDTVIRDMKRGVRHVYWTPAELPSRVLQGILRADEDIERKDVTRLLEHVETPIEVAFAPASLYQYGHTGTDFRAYSCTDPNGADKLFHWKANSRQSVRLRERLQNIYRRLTIMRDRGDNNIQWQGYKMNTLL